MENNNAVAVADNNVSPYEKWNKQQIETIKKTVAVNATDEELDMFLSLCSAYDLNPFLKELWCIKMGGRAIITTSRDGYLKIANRNPNYEGMTSDVVRAGDKFMKQGAEISHAYSANRGQIIGAYAIVYRSDRKIPTYFFAPFDEYYKPGKNGSPSTWDIYPSAMIIKVAESMALKRAFSISGLVTEEEIGTGQEQKAQQPQATAAPQNPPMNPPMTEAQKNERKIQLKQLYHRYLAVCDNQKDHAFNAMKKITGKDKSEDYTPEDIKALFEDVIEREYQKMDEEVAAQAQDAEAIDVQAEEMIENAPTETIPD